MVFSVLFHRWLRFQLKLQFPTVPPFIPNCEIDRELLRFGKLASGIKIIPLGCKNQALKLGLGIV